MLFGLGIEIASLERYFFKDKIVWVWYENWQHPLHVSSSGTHPNESASCPHLMLNPPLPNFKSSREPEVYYIPPNGFVS